MHIYMHTYVCHTPTHPHTIIYILSAYFQLRLMQQGPSGKKTSSKKNIKQAKRKKHLKATCFLLLLLQQGA